MSTAVKSKWLFVGTEKGNTHILNLDHFSLSGYIINWNKAIGVHQSSHPGPVSYLLGKLCIIGRLFVCHPTSLWYSVYVLHVAMDECNKSLSSLFSSSVSESQILFEKQI